jgi:methionine aminotransferase
MEGSSFVPVGCEGTYFQLFDFSPLSSAMDTEFVRQLIVEHGVAAIPVSVFYASGRDEKMIRLCFAKTEETLEKAADILRKVGN